LHFAFEGHILWGAGSYATGRKAVLFATHCLGPKQVAVGENHQGLRFK
jgi:hypothetical protein